MNDLSCQNKKELFLPEKALLNNDKSSFSVREALLSLLQLFRKE